MLRWCQALKSPKNRAVGELERTFPTFLYCQAMQPFPKSGLAEQLCNEFASPLNGLRSVEINKKSGLAALKPLALIANARRHQHRQSRCPIFAVLDS